MAVNARIFPLPGLPGPVTAGIVVPHGDSPNVFFHGVALEAQGGEVRVRFYVGDGSGVGFYPIHLQDGESRADTPFPVGLIVPGDLYVDIDHPEFLVGGGAVFAYTGR